jgi:hypothetical protein
MYLYKILSYNLLLIGNCITGTIGETWFFWNELKIFAIVQVTLIKKNLDEIFLIVFQKFGENKKSFLSIVRKLANI